MPTRSRLEQKENICDTAKSVWTTGAGSTSLITLLKQAANYHECHLQNLTDDQIEEWLRRESKTIEELCCGSVLNG
jgi:hypothetical protein